MVHRDSLMLVCLKKERVYTKEISMQNGPNRLLSFFFHIFI